MEVRITYRSEVTIEGDSLEEIRNKWLDADLYPKRNDEETNPEGIYPEFVELVSVEDADTYEDYMSDFV